MSSPIVDRVVRQIGHRIVIFDYFTHTTKTCTESDFETYSNNRL